MTCDVLRINFEFSSSCPHAASATASQEPWGVVLGALNLARWEAGADPNFVPQTEAHGVKRDDLPDLLEFAILPKLAAKSSR